MYQLLVDFELVYLRNGHYFSNRRFTGRSPSVLEGLIKDREKIGRKTENDLRVIEYGGVNKRCLNARSCTLTLTPSLFQLSRLQIPNLEAGACRHWGKPGG